MSDKPETIDAILAEMRDERIIRLDGADVTRCLLCNLADRIEAAAKRERDDLDAAHAAIASLEEELERLRAPCNAAAMRAALVEVEGAIFEDEPGRFWLADAEVILHRVQAALAAPARNCDISRDTKETIERCLASIDVESSSASFDAGVCAAIGWMLAAPAEGGAK